MKLSRLTLRNSRGQAMVEAALITPVLLLLVLGAYDVSIFASNKVQALGAVRHGVRIAAQLGGVPNNPAPPASRTCDGTIVSLSPEDNVDNIDKQIVQVVVAATTNMNYVTVNEVDIYQPSRPDGAYVSGDPVNRYNKAGSRIGPVGFHLNQRCQGPLGSSPHDASMGVRLNWSYNPANGIPGPSFASILDYSVEKMQECTDNCV